MAKLYEISFWIKKEHEPEKVEEKILKFLEDLKLELIKKVPSKMRNMAYFCTIYFSGEPEKISLLNQKIKAAPEVLRFVILKRKAIKIQPEANQVKEASLPKLEEAISKYESQ